MTKGMRVILTLAFAAALAVVIGVAAGKGPSNVDSTHRFFILRTLAALTAAGLGAILPGFFNIRGKIASLTLSAGGALGLFVLVFLVNPPALVGPGRVVAVDVFNDQGPVSTGSVTLMLDQSSQTATIGPTGRALFAEIPEQYENQAFRVVVAVPSYVMAPPEGVWATTSSGPIRIHVSPVEQRYQPTLFHDVFVASQLDLSEWQSVPVEQRDQKRERAVRKIRTISIRSNDSATMYVNGFGTSGLGLDLICRTHRARAEPIVTPSLPGTQSVKEWNQLIDVSNETVGQPFEIVQEVTYWNAFQGTTTEWAGAVLSYDTDLFELSIIFPPNKPVKSFKLYAFPYASGSKPELYADQTAANVTNNQFVWRINQPARNHVYRVAWEW
ncbi:MAG TPA: hypothetical protein VN493_28575 [Thermoanaerobaculia bacterium]|nr:hypothetical protein [Thermoanaerobaculia bacterium]